jgi:putative ABC transport system permease protein
MQTDSSAVVVNEAFVKMLNYPDPVDKFVYTPADNFGKKMSKYHIIGVMKDFNFKSLRDNVTPLLLNLSNDNRALSVRISTEDIAGLLAQVKDQWKKFSPNQQLSYSFMDDDFDALYRSEQRTGSISIAFTTLAIIIACLGLFGLAAYAAEQRTKEIGVRKVLGANVSTIVNMLSRDFIKLVLIAILIASPLAWWAMTIWLRGFAYKQDIQWWVFLIAGSAAVTIAFLTISFQSVKAALTNPVNSLRSE